MRRPGAGAAMALPRDELATAAGTTVRFQEVGEVALRGLARPVRLYRADQEAKPDWA